MKISKLIWMMVLTASAVLSMTGIVAAQGPPADPPGKPLTSVTQDGSLTGNGTTVSPLGIATGGVTTDKIANGAVTASKTDGTIVTAVTASAPLVSSSGSAPNISLPGVIIASRNTAIGASALVSNTTGFGNTASGTNALANNTTGFGNTASGGGALFSNTTGNGNTASGGAALFSNTTGFSNTAIGNIALFSNTTGGGNTAVGFAADVSTDGLTNATAIGANARVDASNKIRLGDTNVTVIEAQVGITAVSDATKKENFRPVNGEDVLRKIGDFNLTSWNFIGNDPQEFRHYGPMAQDFYAAFGHDEVGTIGTPTTINSGDIAGILMIAVQALEKRTAEQREEVETLKTENATLKALLESLRK